MQNFMIKDIIFRWVGDKFGHNINRQYTSPRCYEINGWTSVIGPRRGEASQGRAGRLWRFFQWCLIKWSWKLFWKARNIPVTCLLCLSHYSSFDTLFHIIKLFFIARLFVRQRPWFPHEVAHVAQIPIQILYYFTYTTLITTYIADIYHYFFPEMEDVILWKCQRLVLLNKQLPREWLCV